MPANGRWDLIHKHAKERKRLHFTYRTMFE